MRKFLWIFPAMAVVVVGYWFGAAYLMTRAVENWMQERYNLGWAADVAQVETTGFPMSFETTLTDIRLADPNTGLGWVAPNLTITSPSTNPSNIFVTLPQIHSLLILDQRVDLTNDAFGAQLHTKGRSQMLVERAGLNITTLQSTNLGDSDISLQDGVLTAQRTGEASYDLTLVAHDVKPGAVLKLAIDPENRLPDVFSTFEIAANISFDRPWDKAAIEERRPNPTRIDLRLAQATWGRLDLKLAGVWDIDPEGNPNGKMTVKATNWREILTLATDMNIMTEAVAKTAESLLGGLAQAAGPPNTLDIPLTFAGGKIWLGFIPLGNAPRVRLP